MKTCLSSSDLEQFQTSSASQSPTLPLVERNEELENLLDALLSCQDALYPQLRKIFDEANSIESKHIEIYVSLCYLLSKQANLLLNTRQAFS